MKLFDGHCDTLLALRYSRQPAGALYRNSLHVDLERGLSLGGYAQFFAIFGTPEFVRDGEDLFDLFYGRFLEELEACGDHMAFCRTGSEADAAVAVGKAAAFLSVEGAEVLNCDPKRLEQAAEKGVRSLCLTWNRATALCGTNVQDPDRGLSAAGKDFVRLGEELGLILDVSHLSDPGFWDLEKLVKGPFAATHSNSRAIHEHTRNLTDDMFRAIRDHGGAAGLNLYTAFLGEGEVTIETVVRHLEHFLDLGGEKTVAMGGDLDGCESLPRGMSGVQDVKLLEQELQKRGYPQDLLDDLFFNNWRRVVGD